MARFDYDVIVVGAGPGGYVAAIRAAQLGFRTAIVEREHLGGICLNWGCIPTKALLHSADMLEMIRSAAEFGIDVASARPNLSRMVTRSREAAAKLSRGIEFLMRKNKIDVIRGQARLSGPQRLAVGPSRVASPAASEPVELRGHGEYTAEHIVLATGARPRILPGFEPDGRTILTYREAMMPTALPKSLLVMGSGAIGAEFASFYRSLGADVTLVEALPQILPQEDAEIAGILHDAFERRGIRVLTGTRAERPAKEKTGIKVTLTPHQGAAETLVYDAVIAAIGVVPNVENLGIEAAGVETGPAGIATDGLGRTNVPGIYAVGDVAGPPMLAHKAQHEAVLCLEAIAGADVEPLNGLRIPACTYCHPQVASVGLSEASAIEAGHSVRIGRFPFAANGKAQAIGDAEGIVKTVFDAESGELLGAHLVGPEVTELVHGFVTALSHETTEEHLMQTIHPHPTLSEAMHESVLNAFGRAIHS